MKNLTVNIVVAFRQSSSDVAKHCWQSSQLLRVNLQQEHSQTVHQISPSFQESTLYSCLWCCETLNLWTLSPPAFVANSSPMDIPWFKTSGSSLTPSLNTNTCSLFSCSLLCYYLTCHVYLSHGPLSHFCVLRMRKHN